jgi:hypothetical protein
MPGVAQLRSEIQHAAPSLVGLYEGSPGLGAGDVTGSARGSVAGWRRACSAPLISVGTATITCPVGTDDTWTAPADVTQATFDVQAAAGGLAINAASAAGNGGHTTAPLTVNPGTTYHIAMGPRATTGATLQAERVTRNASPLSRGSTAHGTFGSVGEQSGIVGSVTWPSGSWEG